MLQQQSNDSVVTLGDTVQSQLHVSKTAKPRDAPAAAAATALGEQKKKKGKKK